MFFKSVYLKPTEKKAYFNLPDTCIYAIHVRDTNGEVIGGGYIDAPNITCENIEIKLATGLVCLDRPMEKLES